MPRWSPCEWQFPANEWKKHYSYSNIVRYGHLYAVFTAILQSASLTTSSTEVTSPKRVRPLLNSQPWQKSHPGPVTSIPILAIRFLSGPPSMGLKSASAVAIRLIRRMSLLFALPKKLGVPDDPALEALANLGTAASQSACGHGILPPSMGSRRICRRLPIHSI